MAHRKRKPRPKPLLPAPSFSTRMYIQVELADIAMFRFLLEAADNLAIFTVADRFRGVLLLRYSEHQERELHEFLKSIRECVRFQVLPIKPALFSA